MESQRKFTPIMINSLEQYITIIKEFCINIWSSNSQFKGEYSLGNTWFRGEPECYPYVLPSLFRGQYNDSISPIASEKKLIKSALQYNPAMFEKCETQLEKLVKMQHYGLPTRLLDITKNPFVALYVACEKEQGTKDGRVLFVDNENAKWADEELLEDFVNLIGIKEEKDDEYIYRYKISYEKVIKYLNDKSPIELSMERKLNIFRNATNSLLFLPKYNNDRIKLQQGAMIFSALYSVDKVQIRDYERLQKVRTKVPLQEQNITENELSQIIFWNTPDCLDNLFKPIVYVIDKDKKHKLMEELRNYGVNEATVYPEPEHQMKYVASCCINPNIKTLK